MKKMEEKSLKPNTLTRLLLPVIALAARFVTGTGGQNAVADWENPAVITRNRVPAHASLFPYDNITAALDLPLFSVPIIM